MRVIKAKLFLTIFFLIVISFTFGQKVPYAKRIADTTLVHGEISIDHYSWLENKEDAQVKKLIRKENDYFNRVSDNYSISIDQVLDKIYKYLPYDYESAEYYDNGYWYKTSYGRNDDYPNFERKKDELGAEWELIFSEGDFIEEFGIFAIWEYTISPDNKYAALFVDFNGDYETDIWFLDLTKTSDSKIFEEKYSLLSNQIKHGGLLEWCVDSKQVFYVPSDSLTNRYSRVYHYDLTTDRARLIYEETDESYDIYLDISKSKEYIFISSFNANNEIEYRIISASKPNENPNIFLKRTSEHNHYLDHFNNKFYLLTNKNAPEFKVLQSSILNLDLNKWEVLIPNTKEKTITDFMPFNDYLAYTTVQNGANALWILDKEKGTSEEVKLGITTPSIYLYSTSDPSGEKLEYSYESYLHPPSNAYYNFKTKESTIFYEEQPLKKYKEENYTSEIRLVRGYDGEMIPLTLVYEQKLDLKESHPVVINGYGAYGISEEAFFDYLNFPLLDEGYILAYAHVRGGADKGTNWYNDGKMFHKKNSFKDFISCTEFLINEGIVDQEKIVAKGGSAGGLLMGGIVNMRPDLYKGVLLLVPFVDIVNTMFRDDLPLTTSEYLEWGNPNIKKEYDYMMSYSPYDNVGKKPYPYLHFVTGLADEQVMYWEPLKMISKIRYFNPEIKEKFTIYVGQAGHSGANSVGDYWYEMAMELAFIFDVMEK